MNYRLWAQERRKGVLAMSPPMALLVAGVRTEGHKPMRSTSRAWSRSAGWLGDWWASALWKKQTSK